LFNDARSSLGNGALNNWIREKDVEEIIRGITYDTTAGFAGETKENRENGRVINVPNKQC
jgi:hypothetical protein